MAENGNCFGCHKDPEQDGKIVGLASFDVNNFRFADPTAYEGKHAAGGFSSDTAAGVADFIDRAMPNCTNADSCADDIAAYLWSLRGQEPVVVEPQSCTSEDPVFYGQRALKLLTSFEYHNSLQALFDQGLPDDFSGSGRVSADKTILRLPNHTKEDVTEGRLNAYNRNAEDLAQWAVVDEMGAPLPFDCADSQSAACASSFINEFAYMAFRRPLTAAEVAEYTDMITGSASGLQWAVRSVLMAPQFLYRSELGVKVSEALEDPNFSVGGGSNVGGSGGGNAAGYELDASNSTTVNARSFTTKADPNGGNDTESTDFYNIWSTGQIGNSFNFPDPALVVVQARGTGYETADGYWPQMTVSVGGQVIAMEMVETTTATTYTYLVTGVTGNQQVQVAFSNMDAGDADAAFYGVDGHDRNLYVGDVTVGAAVMETAGPAPMPIEETDPLMAADPNAYVLDPYEYAAALSYIYTASTPDKTLLDAAANGELSDPANVEAQIDRMLDSTLGQEQVGRFAGMWLRTDEVLGVNRDSEAFTAEVKESMAQEIRELYKHVFYTEGASFADLYNGNFTMLDSTLSQYYGIPGGGAQHLQFTRVNTEGTARGGVLASGAFMASNAHMNVTSPVKRAVHLREDILCQQVPPQPVFDEAEKAIRAERQALVEELQENGRLTTTEFYDQQTTLGQCNICHRDIINPLFGMDDFDNIGRARKMVGDQVVQKGLGATGQEDVPIAFVNEGGMLYGASFLGALDAGEVAADREAGNGIAFSGAKDLSRKVAELPNAKECLVQKTFRYSQGYALGTEYQIKSEEKALSAEQEEHYTCVAENLTSALSNSGSPREMLKALGMSDVVRFRR